MLQLVNKDQSRKLRELGFNLKVRDLYVLKTRLILLADHMEVDENWNKFSYTISRPSVAEALQWLRLKFKCKCEVIIPDWNDNLYAGQFKYENENIILTRTYSDRYSAEIELLSVVLGRLIKLA